MIEFFKKVVFARQTWEVAGGVVLGGLVLRYILLPVALAVIDWDTYPLWMDKAEPGWTDGDGNPIPPPEIEE